MFGNNGALGLQDEVANSYAATITLDPNLGSKHNIINMSGDFNLAIEINTDTDLLALYIHNNDVSSRTLTWSTNVLSGTASEVMGAGTKWVGIFVKMQGKWCKASFIQLA